MKEDLFRPSTLPESTGRTTRTPHPSAHAVHQGHTLETIQPRNTPRVWTEIPGPKSRALTSREAAHLAPGVQSISTLSGIAVARAESSIIEDVDGNRFLDLAAGICVNALGHSHPEYGRILKDQIDHAMVGSFTTPRRVDALEKVSSHLPEGLDRLQFYSGGSEAVEAALRLAKSYTKKYEFLSFWGGFHGKTAGTMSLIGDGTKNHLGPNMPGTYLTPYADCYRCPLALRYPSCGIECAQFARKVIKNSTTGELAAILIEPIQGTAGNIVPPPEFMPIVREIASENNALLLADEMITGFGRTGKWFAVEHFGVKPDIMTLGKGLGAGFPVAGLASTAAITSATPWGNPSGSSSSYGANPLASAAVLAASTVIENENLVENAARVGEFMLGRFKALQEKYEFIGDVRGKGLLIGIELVKDRVSKEPLDKKVCVRMFHEGMKRGLISMIYNPHFRVNPALSIDQATADTSIAILDEVFSLIVREGNWR